MHAQISRITDILRTDTGINGAMTYTEQISRILFLKFLDDYEKNQIIEATLNGKSYTHIFEQTFQWETWACPKLPNGKPDTINQMVGDDLSEFVNLKLFPYLKSFRNDHNNYRSIKYKIGEIFFYMTNRIEQGNTLREVLDIVDNLNFQSNSDLFELSQIYEDLLQGMGNDGGNSGEFYTPRPVIKAMVQCLDPEIGQTIYDGATGSCGFLIDAHTHLKAKVKTTQDLHRLNHDALRGNEQTPLAYVMGVMNMILHGIENPNIIKKNTLIDNIKDFEEKDGYNIILANPPFGAKQKPSIQSNFPIKTNATEMLFLQHFMKKLKTGGKAAIIVPEGVLFNTSNAFAEVKKELVSHFNLHTIVSLPAGIFLPYSGVKTNIIFFDKTKPTEQIRYYEVDPGRKLTKNKPITSDDMADMVVQFIKKSHGPNSRTVSIDDIRDYDLSAKNPAKVTETIHRSPAEILADIDVTNANILEQTAELKKMIGKSL